MTKKEAILSCFSYLEELEKEMSIRLNQEFDLTDPYHVHFTDSTVTVYGWSLLDGESSEKHKYGIKIQFEHQST